MIIRSVVGHHYRDYANSSRLNTRQPPISHFSFLRTLRNEKCDIRTNVETLKSWLDGCLSWIELRIAVSHFDSVIVLIKFSLVVGS